MVVNHGKNVPQQTTRKLAAASGNRKSCLCWADRGHARGHARQLCAVAETQHIETIRARAYLTGAEAAVIVLVPLLWDLL
jgi:hypothetical protein